MSDTSNLTNLGDKSQTPTYSNPSKEMLEAFPLEKSEDMIVVALDCLEFTSICPMTGQPDFAKIYISYIPNKLCVETKSLKFYLTSYRNEGAFYEDLIQKIAEDIQHVVKAKYLRVHGGFSVRGGIAIKTLAIKQDKSLSENDLFKCRILLQEYDSINNN